MQMAALISYRHGLDTPHNLLRCMCALCMCAYECSYISHYAVCVVRDRDAADCLWGVCVELLSSGEL